MSQPRTQVPAQSVSSAPPLPVPPDDGGITLGLTDDSTSLSKEIAELIDPYTYPDPSNFANENLPPELLAVRDAVSAVIYLCSVYPKPLVSKWRYLNRRRVRFAMPAADWRKPDGYVVRPIPRTNEWLINRTNPDSHEVVPHPVPAQWTAQQLIREWAGDREENSEGFSIGVGVIAGPKPTPSELQKLIELQLGAWRWRVSRADQWWVSGNQKLIAKINEGHREALEFLGTEDYANHPWARPIKVFQSKSCLACASDIQGTALVCPKCSTDLIEFCLKNGMTPANDPVVAERVRFRLAAKAS